MCKGLCVFVAMLLLMVGVQSARATAIITMNVGSYNMSTNSTLQIPISISGGEAIQGMDFRVQVADGGPTLGAGHTVVGPNITGVDVLTGTIFAANNNGVRDPNAGQGYTQFDERFTSTNSGTVNASGLVATLTVETNGIAPGVYSLEVSGTADGDTDFPASPTSFSTTNDNLAITNGSITVSVPEPATLSLFACVGGALLLGRRRRRR